MSINAKILFNSYDPSTGMPPPGDMGPGGPGAPTPGGGPAPTAAGARRERMMGRGMSAASALPPGEERAGKKEQRGFARH